ncbi:hypothetical protein Hanom_Chr12g01177731 [Helianthus anomalus]
MGLMSPLGVGSTPPMSPNGNMWQNKFVNVTPPALDLEIELELLQRQFGEMKPTKLDDVYGSNLLDNKFGRTLTRLDQVSGLIHRLQWHKREDANKLRKSSSFGFRSGSSGSPMKANHEPDDLWAGVGLYSSSETVPQWVEQMYTEQEKLMA